MLSNSETEGDDSTWEAEFRKRLSASASATPPVGGAIEADKRDLYVGDMKSTRGGDHVYVVESASLMKYADYKPCEYIFVQSMAYADTSRR